MRAIFIERLPDDNNSELVIYGETHHHLARVVRVRNKDQVLLLDGQGLRAIGSIKAIEKKSTIIVIEEIDRVDQTSSIAVACGLLKRDAMDDVLKSAVELNVSRLYILKSKYSQNYDLNMERAKKIFISALEQSNNSYFPELLFLNGVEELRQAAKTFDSVAFFTTGTPKQAHRNISFRGTSLLVIGPEGGFSDEEEVLFSAWPEFEPISIQGPIMRAPTAVSFAVGYAQGCRTN